MPPDPPFAVHIRTRGTVPIVELHGEIDLMAVPYISLRLDGLAHRERGGHPQDLVIDLTAVTFMDCRGLSVLVHARALTTARHGQLHLTNVPAPVRRLLHLTGLESAFPSRTPASAAYQPPVGDAVQ
ncbi:STAS domain-containing protein [Streptomyces sp. H39-S7]|uniref:STAS domain-containing protein n=1 Tax=Streptomyces sp. H39-S7 TaxID=3004357 RepID=UPI0022AF8476|nr:STAS domain-containing protein [Streptomyces sp. H39-S7]MCZ4120784.1 STAS domain-containing protein [Streptomyces sp. H39-S7]